MSVVEEAPPVVEELPLEALPAEEAPPLAEELPPDEPSTAAEQPVESPVLEEQPPVEAPAVVEAPAAVEAAPDARPIRRLRAVPAQAPAEVVAVESPAPAPSLVLETGPLNDLALVAGWNAPSGWGGRYLRRFPGTSLAAGAGLAPLTLWGIKLSLIVRRAPNFEHGFFQQISVGLSTGSDKEEEVLVDESGARAISLRKTPGRTLDFVVGYRWAVFTRSFAELFTGWSFNFQGTYLQNAEISKVPIPQSLREELDVRTPGGLVLGLSFGWRF